MNGNSPTHLSRPPLAAYQFINIVFDNRLVDIAHYTRVIFQQLEADRLFSSQYFCAPHMVRNEQMLPIQAMHETTLDRLLKILKPKLQGTEVTSIDDLAREATNIFDEIKNGSADIFPTYQQVESYALHKARLPASIHWGQLSDLYNESAHDQQEAIHDFFEQCLNRNLEKLFSTPSSDLVLPDSLCRQFERKNIDGDVMVFSEVEQAWIREDLFEQVFAAKVYFKGSADSEILIGTAPTLAQVIAMATMYAKNTNVIGAGGDTVKITIYDDTLATAVIEPLAVSKDAVLAREYSEAKVKLKWNLDKVGINTDSLVTILEMIVSQAETVRQKKPHAPEENLDEDLIEVNRLISAKSSENSRSFTHTLMRVERTLGVQWSKVQRLEDELGL